MELEPKDFEQEFTTMWSFPDRGTWATHSGSDWRGNWSPYVPRNLILKYSKPGDVVLDCFIGGGTTAVEAKLLARNCIGVDINPKAIELAKQKVKFKVDSHDREPVLMVEDARNLHFVKDNSVDLVCSHPPYADAIKYSKAIPGDLSRLPVKSFLEEMRQVAVENYRVLKPGRYCAVLIGDKREKRRVVPLGMMVMRVYLRAGFVLKEIIIKAQHNCRMDSKWVKKAKELNFLLLGHEYLPVFEKPAGKGDE